MVRIAFCLVAVGVISCVLGIVLRVSEFLGYNCLRTVSTTLIVVNRIELLMMLFYDLPVLLEISFEIELGMDDGQCCDYKTT